MKFENFTPEQTDTNNSRKKYLKETKEKVGEKTPFLEKVKGIFGKESAPSDKVTEEMIKDATTENNIREITKKNKEIIDAESEVFVPYDDSLKDAIERGYVIKGRDKTSGDPEIMDSREKQQQELLEFLKNNEKDFDVIRTLIDYILKDRRFSDERVFYGGSSEIREWERKISPTMSKMIKKEIKRRGISDEQVDEILSKIFISMPELFIASTRSYPQEVLNENYKKIQQGDYSSVEGYRNELKDNWDKKE